MKKNAISVRSKARAAFAPQMSLVIDRQRYMLQKNTQITGVS